MWRVASTIEQDGDGGERTLGHVKHFHHMSTPSPAHVRSLFGLPRHHTRSQEQEETREEHGEKHKQIYVQLVLAEEHCSVSRVSDLKHMFMLRDVNTGNIKLTEVHSLRRLPSEISYVKKSSAVRRTKWQLRLMMDFVLKLTFRL